MSWQAKRGCPALVCEDECRRRYAVRSDSHAVGLNMTSYLERYLAGEHEQVWAELVTLGPYVRDEPTYTDALAVAQETMRRARHNIELLVPRLRESGYVFDLNCDSDDSDEVNVVGLDLMPIYTSPTADASAGIRELENLVGILPLSLRAWYELVGSVNFIGTHPAWKRLHLTHGTDPLFVYSLDVALNMARTYLDMGVWHKEPILALAPDEYHKFGVSGAGAYGVRLPSEAADTPLLLEWHHTTFVDYLRICFRYAGFPGLEHAQPARLHEIERLAHELLPI